MSSCPFHKPACTGEKMWNFIGDDGKHYANFNGPVEMAMLCIGWENPHLVDLRLCVLNKDGSVRYTSNARKNLDQLFEMYGHKRPKE